MIRSILIALLLVLPLCAAAQEKQQYIDDEITVTLRDAPRNDASYLGTVSSGDRVTVLESLGEQSFAKIRTADGREGWITARFLSDEPAAKDALSDVKKDLAQARQRIASLEHDLQQAQAELKKARPALELSQANDQLRDQIAQLEKDSEQVKARYNEQKARQRTLLTGAGLVGAGVFLGLLLPWFVRSTRRQRWGDF